MTSTVEPVGDIVSRLVPLRLADIDTDQIIPSRHLTSRTPEEFSRALFANRRGADFVLDQPDMVGRTVLLAGRNFGCGSSREQAVWALRAGGFRAVLAPSFSDIFSANAVRNGLLLVQLDDGICDTLAAVALADPHRDVVVSLRRRQVTVPGTDFTAGFPFDDFFRELLLDGVGELDYLLRALPEISAYESSTSAHG